MRMWGPASPTDAIRVGPPGAPGSRILTLAAGVDPDPARGRAQDLAFDLSRCLVWVRSEAGWGAPQALGGAVIAAITALSDQAGASAAAAAAAATRAEAAEAAVRQIQIDVQQHMTTVVADLVVDALGAPTPALIAAVKASLAATLASLPTDIPTTDQTLWLAGRTLSLS